MKCHKCKLGEIQEKVVQFKASFTPFLTPESVKIETIACNSCDYFVINQEHVDNLRKIVK